MTVVDNYLITDERPSQQRQRQSSPYASTTPAHSLRNVTEILLTDLPSAHANESLVQSVAHVQYSFLLFKIGLGFVCACLCLLTVTGNLLVLVTFRRLRTVSIRCVLTSLTDGCARDGFDHFRLFLGWQLVHIKPCHC